MITLKLINFVGSTQVLGFNVRSLVANHEWSIFMMDGGMIKIVRGNEVVYLGPSMWMSCEEMVTTGVTQGEAFTGALGSSNVAAASNIPEGMYRNTDGELEAPVVAKNIHRARKTPKPQ